MTPDQRIDAVKAALAEAGYPDAEVEGDGEEKLFISAHVASDVAWRAIAISHPPDGFPCWTCWLDLDSLSPLGLCPHDWRTEPWPEVVR